MRLALAMTGVLLLAGVWAHGYATGAAKMQAGKQAEIGALQMTLAARSASLAHCEQQLVTDNAQAQDAVRSYRGQRDELVARYAALASRLQDSHDGECRDWALQPVCGDEP